MQCCESESSWIRNFFLDPDLELFVSDPDQRKNEKQITKQYVNFVFALIVQKIQ